MKNKHLEAIVDVGNIIAAYQPGHSHADTFNYELRRGGKSYIVDTGISTYNKTDRRQLERSTRAHNTVSVNGYNSSEVWGGFRVGRRAEVCILNESQCNSKYIIEASHNGFEKPCHRRFTMTDSVFVVEDWYDGEAVSYVHMAEGADEKNLRIEGIADIEIRPWKYSTEYNRFKEGKEIKITFNNYLKYTIQ